MHHFIGCFDFHDHSPTFVELLLVAEQLYIYLKLYLLMELNLAKVEPTEAIG